MSDLPHNTHPLLIELADFVDGTLDQAAQAAIRFHVDHCRTCRAMLQRAGTPPSLPPIEIPSNAAHLETKILDMLRGDPPEPRPGQLWRVRWNEAVALCVILRIEADEVTAVPVGLEDWMADDYAVIVATAWSPIDSNLAVWVNLESVVPLFVLDVWLGDVDILDQIAEVRRAYQKGIDVPDTIVVGTRIHGPTDERNQYRRGLALRMASLSDAHWLNVSKSSPDSPSISTLLADLDPRELGKALDLDAPNIFDLVSGSRLISPAEAEVLSDVVGIPPSELLAATPDVPRDLLHELNHPAHRRAIERRADKAGHSEADERLRALHELLPVAARRAGDKGDPLDWRRLVRDCLAE